jgi:hypothetical protein
LENMAFERSWFRRFVEAERLWQNKGGVAGTAHA